MPKPTKTILTKPSVANKERKITAEATRDTAAGRKIQVLERPCVRCVRLRAYSVVRTSFGR